MLEARTIVMMQALEQVIAQTKNDYNLGIHEFSFALVIGISQL